MILTDHKHSTGSGPIYQMLDPGNRIHLAVIIPVWQEKQLVDCLTALLSELPPASEVIVVDGDAFGSSLRDLPQKPGLLPLISPRKGRGYQLRFGVEHALADILLFLHADTRLPPGGIRLMLEMLQTRPEVAGGVFDLGIDSPRFIYRLIETFASWRSRITRLPYGDQTLFLRRLAYDTVDGFPEVPIMEDVGICQRLKRRGLSLCFVSQKVMTSPRRWESEGLVRCTLRNWVLLLAYLCGVAPETLARWYR